MQNLDNQIFLITGSTDGIGLITARKLADRGGHVLIHGRDEQKARRVKDETEAAVGTNDIQYFTADFSSLENVRRLADEVLHRHDRLDVLINNAGVGFGEERQLSEEDYELRFTVNYLAPFLLTHLLLPALRNAAPSRVVNVSSAGHYPIDFDDIMLEKSYSPQRAYGQSKLALIMFTMELAERLRDDKITVNCLHPGTLLNTKMVINAGITPQGKAEDGADVVVRLATATELTRTTGKYYDRKKESRAISQAYKKKDRHRLWRVSEELTGLCVK